MNDPLIRVRTLIQTRRPRILEFLQDFDRLRRGVVSLTQFYRALEAMDIRFTGAERSAIEQRYGTATMPIEMHYRDVVRDLEASGLSAQLCPKGSLTGTTAAYSTLVLPAPSHEGEKDAGREDVAALLESIRRWVVARPVMGRLFFEDFDVHRTGLITASQFGRGLSTMWEALIRQFPTKRQIDLLAAAFRSKRLLEEPDLHSGDASAVRREVSDAMRANEALVDYRLFVATVRADQGDTTLRPADHGHESDPAFARYFDGSGRLVDGQPGLARVIQAWLKLRPDFKAFLLARDTQHRGVLPYRDFCSALSATLLDSGRTSVDFEDIRLVADGFLRADALNTSDPEGQPVDYRAFLAALNDASITMQGAGVLRQASPPLAGTAAQREPAESAESAEPDGAPVPPARFDHALAQKLRKYLHDYPAPLLQSFENFDPRHSGLVTSQQFKQVLSMCVPIYTEGRTPSVIPADAAVRTTKFIRAQQGLSDRELDRLATQFACSTVSGRGTVERPSNAPDVLAGSGLYIRYRDFVRSIDSASVLLPAAEGERHASDVDEYVLPHPGGVVRRIVASLQQRNLKLADSLLVGDLGDARRSRSATGNVGCRNIQRNLSYNLDIALTDAELVALGLCYGNAEDPQKSLGRWLRPEGPDQGQGQDQGRAAGRTVPGASLLVAYESVHPLTGADYGAPYPSRIRRCNLDRALIARALDLSEISVRSLARAIEEQYDAWAPSRTVSVSYKAPVPAVDADGVAARCDPAGYNDTFNNISVGGPQAGTVGNFSEFRFLNGDEVVFIKGRRYTLGQLRGWCSRPLPMDLSASAAICRSELDAQVSNAAPFILSVYMDLHQRAGRPLDAFREFDGLRSGFVTKDNFARAFVICNMEKLCDLYLQAFKVVTQMYTCIDQSSRFYGMVDYVFFLRDVSLPPETSIFLSADEILALKRQKYGEAATAAVEDYASVVDEFNQTWNKQVYAASKGGVIEQLAGVCKHYRPKLRDHFLDFDRRRSGLCEMSKVGDALAFLHADLNDEQVSTLRRVYRTEREGFADAFNWAVFCSDIEKELQFRL